MSDHLSPAPGDPLVRAIDVVHAFFKAVDDHPECHPAAEVGHIHVMGERILPRSASPDEEERLVDATIGLFEAVEVLDPDACSDEHLWHLTKVMEFARHAEELVRSWTWDWALRPERRGHVEDFKRRFTEDVESPFLKAVRALLRAMRGGEKFDSAMFDRVASYARQASGAEFDPAGLGTDEARRDFERLWKSFHEGPRYGPGGRKVYRADLLLKLATIHTELSRFFKHDPPTGVETATPQARDVRVEVPEPPATPPRESSAPAASSTEPLRRYRRGDLDARATAVLMDNPNLTYEQIASILGCNPNSLKDKRLTKFHAAREALKKGRLRYWHPDQGTG